MDAKEMVDRPNHVERQYLWRQSAQRLTLSIAEHIIGELVGLVERGAVNLAERIKVRLGRATLCVKIGVGDVVTELVSIAQVWLPPAAIAVALLMPTTVTGMDELLVVPSPSFPAPLLPQHCTAPLASTAQVW